MIFNILKEHNRKSLRRNKIGTLIFLPAFFLFTFYINAQEERNYINHNMDSTYRFHGIIPPLEFQYYFEEIFSNPVVSQIPKSVLLDDNPSTIWLRTEILLLNNSAGFRENEINTHFTSPLYSQYLKNSEFDIVRTILGAAQAGAVAYMAYRHIKKYGFWK